MRTKLITGAIAVLMATALLTSTMETAEAQEAPPPTRSVQGLPRHVEWTHNRGWVTSSVYFTERATRWICDAGPAALAIIAPIPERFTMLLKVGAALLVWKACQARVRENCLRIRYVHVVLSIVGLYNVRSTDRWCRRSWRTV